MSEATDPFFADLAAAAFPPSHRDVALAAIEALAPFIDDSYRQGSVEAWVDDKIVCLPGRIHFPDPPTGFEADRSTQLTIQCLASRSTDGFIRQHALRELLGATEPWVIPFVVILAGEYVVEIAGDITTSLPLLDRAAYANFVRENRPLMRLLRARATSYWDAYYRRKYPNKAAYPALVFLREIESWAA